MNNLSNLSYARDHRVAAADKPRWFSEINTLRMEATIDPDFYWNSIAPDSDPHQDPIRIKIKFEVCPTCEGKGTHVNPSIDAHGISAEEFDDDPDFRGDYFSGRYDQPCNECGGQRVVAVPHEDEKAFSEALERFLLAEAEHASERRHEIAMGY